MYIKRHEVPLLQNNTFQGPMRTGLDFFSEVPAKWFHFDIPSILSKNTCLIRLSFQLEKGLEKEKRCLVYPQQETREHMK